MAMFKMMAVSAVLAAGAACADDGAAAGNEAPAAENKAQATSRSFAILPFCSVAEGQADVRRPGAADWESAEEGRHYPLGSAYRVRSGGKLTLSFGEMNTVGICGEASFGTLAQGLGVASRTVVLMSGTIELNLANSLAQGSFFVTAPGFTVKNPAGESKITYADAGDGDVATVRCVTGTLGIEGRHFDIAAMHAADEIRIRTSRGNLETILYGTSGDYTVNLSRGIVSKVEVSADGERKNVSAESVLGWHLTPKTKVRISRMMPALGARMSVAVMTFDAAGEMKNNFAFAEGRAEVNTGELVAAPKEDRDEAVKKAAEVTETTAVTDEDAEEADEDSKNNNEKTETEEE